MSDPACGLVFRDLPNGEAEASGMVSRRTQQLLWLLVIGMHVLLAVLWQQAARLRAVAVDAALEVVWISVPRVHEPVVPPMPMAPERAVTTPARLPPSRAPAVIATEAAAVADAPAAIESEATLFMPDGRLRMAQPEAKADVWGDRERISRDRITRLPGETDSAAAERVALRLRRQFTPEDVVLAVVQFLMGRPRPDDCSKIEGRLHMSDPGVSREIDLNKFRRACSGISRREAFGK